MSRLYASVDSDARQKPVTSRGHKHVEAHVRGWTSGVKVVARTEDDKDVFDVFATSGSSSYGQDELVGTMRDGFLHRDGAVVA